MKNRSEKVFKTPFSREYWSLSFSEMKHVKTIVLVGILIAMTIGLETLGTVLPITLFTRKVFFSFLPIALSSMLFGPIVALVFGFIADILGFLMQGGASGAFFPGYTLSAMLGAFIYSIFLYRTRITVLKIFLAKFMVNVVVNITLGSLWLYIMYGKKTFWVYLVGGFFKNMILLPFEVILLYIMLNRLIPISKNFNLISDEVDSKIKLI